VASVARKGRARRFREARAFKQGFGDRPLDEALLGDILSSESEHGDDDEDDDEDDDDEFDDDDDPYADLYDDDEDDEEDDRR
jgi:hypothetical protein